MAKTILRSFSSMTSNSSHQLRRTSAAALDGIETIVKIRPEEKRDDDVQFATRNGAGVITLNRQKALNSMNISMLAKIFPTLLQWERTQSMVIIKGVGDKAFCAGGDVRAIVDDAKAGGDLYKRFFKSQYSQNYLIGTYQIPYVSLMDGITMGGGSGLSVHGRFRVATERTLFAMPETGIGYFCDVGSSYFLPRLRNGGLYLGRYLAMTGYRLSPADALYAGIATHACISSNICHLEEDLVNLKDKSVSGVNDLLKYYTDLARKDTTFEDPALAKVDARIRKHFARRTAEEIVSSLEEDGSPWAQKTLQTILRMCPLSLKVSLRALLEGSEKSLQDCLKTEYRLSRRFSPGFNFAEGSRALLVEKDNKPNWQPPTLQEVTDKMVDDCFKSLASPEEELIL